MKQSAAQIVRTALTKIPAGEPFAARPLLARGPQAAMQKELERLAKTGAIRRVAYGIFVRPEHSPYVKGEVPPEITKVVKAAAQQSGTVVQVHGAEAARRLGFSTQVPMQSQFLTSGISKTLKVGNLAIRLKHVSPRKLVLAGRPAGLALTALWYLGKEEVGPSTFSQIERKIGSSEFEALTKARNHMPAWMSKALHAYEQVRTVG